MTEQQVRNRFAKTAEAYWGYKESDNSHKEIIDIYNTKLSKLPRGYAVKPTDEWCATFVSAIGAQLGWSDIILPECSCNKMIELYKAAGRWQEDDSYTPNPGDIVMYDWEDNGNGDNTGVADHVGIVVSVPGQTISVIEGNKNGEVGYRSISVNAKNIRGYCLPNFKSKSEEKQEVCDVNLPVLQKGLVGNSVKSLQILLIGHGHSCGNYGTDGIFGDETDRALREFQKANNLDVDGICGSETWNKLLGME